MTAGGLHGRTREQAALDGLLAGARAGEGGGLVVRGEPGVGKSALLAYAAERAAGLGVLRAVGAESETLLAYAGLQRLLSPVLDRADRLPPPQARALGVALGLEAGLAPDRFLIALAALTLLSEAAGERPLLCLVDDLQWLDAPSAAAVAFVARRLAAEPVGLLLALREGEGRAPDTADLPELRLAGLDPGAAAALLEERWGARLTPAVRRRLAVATGGNPLALIELPGALTGEQAAGLAPLPEPLPLAGALERAFLERIRRRDAREQGLLLLAAADSPARLATLRRAAGALGLDAAALEAAPLADLLRREG